MAGETPCMYSAHILCALLVSTAPDVISCQGFSCQGDKRAVKPVCDVCTHNI